MAKQSINIGTVANDGTGSTLRAGGDLINDNFNELYTNLGDGTDLQISVAGASSVNQVLQWSTLNSRFEPVEPLFREQSKTISTTQTFTTDNTKYQWVYGPITIASGVVFTVTGNGSLTVASFENFKYNLDNYDLGEL